MEFIKMNMDMENGCCRHTERTERERTKLLTRLKTVEGQIRGIEKMVENDAYCPDIVMQVSAVTNALNSFNKLLLAAHIRGCVTEDIREGKEDKVDELCAMLQKVMK
jgi:DNA-binding FrmR family transcriptional regulator